MRDLQPDAHTMTETNAYCGNETLKRGNEQAFMAALGKGTLSCAYNTHHILFQLVRGGGVRPYVLHLREGGFMETIIVVQLCVEP